MTRKQSEAKRRMKVVKAWMLIHPCHRYNCDLLFSGRKAARDYKRGNEYFDHRVARVEIREVKKP